jgi:hypothetical protein
LAGADVLRLPGPGTERETFVPAAEATPKPLSRNSTALIMRLKQVRNFIFISISDSL